MARIKSFDTKEIARDEERAMLGKQLLIASSRNDLEKVKALIEKGADPNYRNIHNETPVLAACEGSAMDVLQFLLTKGASLDVKSSSDQHPIHMASAAGNEAMVKLLAQRGQNLSAQAYDGSTPLHVATRQGQADVARWLLTNKSVNVNKADYSGLTPAHIAAVMPRRKPVLDVLLANGANLNKESFRGDTVLHLAARKAEPEILIYLIEKGAKIGCPQCGKDGKNCEVLDERAANFLRQEAAKWKTRQKEMKKDASKEKKEKKGKDAKDKPQDVRGNRMRGLALTFQQKESPPTMPNSGAGERKSFDGARPDPPAAATATPAPKEKKGGFLGFLRGSSGKERTSSPGKTMPAPAPAPAPTSALAAPAPAATVAGQKERPEAERPPEAIAVPDITVPDK